MALDEQKQILAGAASLGIQLSGSAAALLERLLDELERWNRAYNLTSVRSREAMVTRHVLDSLSIGALLQGEQVIDVGSGAGFPGLPLAIAYPERSFTLIDANQKKIRFLSHVVRTLGLGNVTPLHARVELAEPKRHRADTITARAFAPLGRLLSQIRPLANDRTRVIAMKAQLDPAELASAGDEWQIEDVQALAVPGLTAERCAVIARLRPSLSAPEGFPPPCSTLLR